MSKAKIHYLYHSGFAVETENHFLIFDYFMDKHNAAERSLQNGLISEEDIKKHKNICVFVSHSHEDHFNPVIFNWVKINPNINYILSSDIKEKGTYPRHMTISENESIVEGDISIKALGSTDIGISFLVKVDGLTIFHAGDLNWWHWYDESDEYNVEMEKAFKFQIDKLEGENIHIAFFPVDPRLKEYYYLGGKYFIQKLSPELFVPMHFGNKYEVTKEFYKKLEGCSTKIVEMHTIGQEIIF